MLSSPASSFLLCSAQVITDTVHPLAKSLTDLDCVLVAVDEAHVVRQWGFSAENSKTPALAPAYAKLSKVRSFFGARNPPVMALSASFSATDWKKLPRVLGLKKPGFIQSTCDRPNIKITVRRLGVDEVFTEDRFFDEWVASYRLAQAKGESMPKCIVFCDDIETLTAMYVASCLCVLLSVIGLL